MDKQELKRKAEDATRGNNRPVIGTKRRGFKGKKFSESGLTRDPCATFRWLDENTGLRWSTYLRMDGDGSYQGLLAKKGKKTEIKIEVEVTGGDVAEPYKQMAENNRTLISKGVEYVISNNKDLR